MNAEELAKYKGVFVFAQQVDNVLSGISFELVGEGKRLAEKLCAAGEKTGRSRRAVVRNG